MFPDAHLGSEYVKRQRGTRARPAYLPPRPTGEAHLRFWKGRLKEPSFVYVIQANGDTPIKVGVAKDVHARMRTLQTGNPRQLRLLYVVPGAHALETKFHRQLRHSRLCGEWFDGPDVPGFLSEVQELAQRMVDSGRPGECLPAPETSTSGDTVRYVEPNPVSPEEQQERLRAAWCRRRPSEEYTLG